MPRKNQIPFFVARPLTGGRITYYWTPSPKLRALGFRRVLLGDDLTEAVTRAIAINREVEEGLSVRKALSVRMERPLTFRELVDRYRRSPEWEQLATATRREYGSRLNNLIFWTNDGTTLIRAIDEQMVKDLRDALVKDGRRHRTAAILRVLRIVLGYARHIGEIATNPAAGDLRIPEPPARTRMLTLDVVMRLVAQAEKDKLPSMALAIELGFWIIQRQGDLLALSAASWREIKDVDPRDRAALAGPDGRVMGFRLRQRKTGVWIDAPVPPALRVKIEVAMQRQSDRKSTWIIGHHSLDQAYASRNFGTTFRAVVDAAIEAAGGEAAPAAADLLDLQFRDLRRSGMCFYGEWGVSPNLITALSGHAVLGKRSILDTYMPGNTRSACACVATAVRAIAAREAMEGSEQG